MFFLLIVELYSVKAWLINLPKTVPYAAKKYKILITMTKKITLTLAATQLEFTRWLEYFTQYRWYFHLICVHNTTVNCLSKDDELNTDH